MRNESATTIAQDDKWFIADCCQRLREAIALVLEE